MDRMPAVVKPVCGLVNQMGSPASNTPIHVLAGSVMQ